MASSSLAARWEITSVFCSANTCGGLVSARLSVSAPPHLLRVKLSLASTPGFRGQERINLARAATKQVNDDPQLESIDQDDNDDEDVCELVSRLDLTLGEAENAFAAYLVKAMKNNNGAAVLLLSDVFGYNNKDTRDFAYRLSCFGYNVLVPDLFRGMPRSENGPGYEEWRANHPSERVANDIDTSARWFIEEMAAAGVPSKLGLVGFCFGGGRILEVLAGDELKQYATAVSFYPTRFDAALAARINVPILLISGDQDELCPVEKLKKFASETDGQFRVYSGRGHGFAHRPSSAEDDDDAEDAFLAMKSWLHDKLVSSSQKS